MGNYSKSHEYIYNQYYKTSNPVTKRSYLDILIRRASNGSSVAKYYVDEIKKNSNA